MSSQSLFVQESEIFSCNFEYDLVILLLVVVLSWQTLGGNLFCKFVVNVNANLKSIF